MAFLRKLKSRVFDSNKVGAISIEFKDLISLGDTIVDTALDNGITSEDGNAIIAIAKLVISDRYDTEMTNQIIKYVQERIAEEETALSRVRRSRSYRKF